ncbi:MAG: transposase [Bdellovibrionota bacterium]
MNKKQSQQTEFQKTNWKHRYSYGGQLRNCRQGRGSRVLTRKAPIHLVFKANKEVLRGGFRTYRRYFLIQKLVDIYAKKFFVKIEQITVQSDHLHLLIRINKRSQAQNFFRVFAGQVSQRLKQEGLVNFSLAQKSATDTPLDTPKNSRHRKKLWKYRPFTRVVKGWKPYQIVRNYIQLNEKEALGVIPYRKERLTGLSLSDWELLWV